MDPPFDALRLVVAECALSPRFIAHHLAGFARDVEGWRPDTEEDLLSYCYQVAGVVGCMMAIVMGVSPDDEETLDRACDLGIAFQLANIARDLGEDHSVGRCYLPAAWLDEVGAGADEIEVPQHVVAVVYAERGLPIPDIRNSVLLLTVLFQNSYVLCMRSERRPAHREALGSNPWLLAGVAIALALHATAMYWPPMQRILGTGPVDGWTVAICAGAVVLVILTTEITKHLVRIGMFQRTACRYRRR